MQSKIDFIEQGGYVSLVFAGYLLRIALVQLDCERNTIGFVRVTVLQFEPRHVAVNVRAKSGLHFIFSIEVCNKDIVALEIFDFAIS